VISGFLDSDLATAGISFKANFVDASSLVPERAAYYSLDARLMLERIAILLAPEEMQKN
jgi:hypothetical protein